MGRMAELDARLPQLKAAHHMDHLSMMVKLLADQLDVMLLDMDGADEYTELVNDLETVGERADELSKQLMQEALE